MGLGDFWLQSNNGKKISLDNLKELKKSDLKNNPELIKLFDIFNTNKSSGSEEVLDKQELNSLFNTFSKAAQSQKGKNTSIFETEEAEDFINSNSILQETNIKTSDLFDFLSKIVKPQNEQKTISEPSRKTKTNQEVKAGVIESLRSDSDETLKIISNMNNGDISDIYDSVKTFLDMDTSKAKVLEAAVNQAQGAKYMEKAQSGGLTREEYIKANKQRLQDMMKARLYKKDKNGIDYLDKNRADLKMSRKEFEALMLATIERMTDDMDIKSVKEKMRQLPMTTENGDRFLMDSIKQNAIVLFGKAKSAGCSTLDLATKYIYDTTKIVKPSPDDKKLLTFDEVFYYEQGVNYSKEDCEKYLDVQTQLTKNLSSYNKYLEFKTGADKILKEKDAEKALNDVIKLFEQFYSDPSYPNLAYKNLKSVVKNSNLPINVTQDETGRISISMVSGSEDLLLSYVSDILAAEGNVQQERLDKVFGGNAEEKLEELQKKVEQAHEKAYGNDFSSTLGKAMIEDNQTFIQRYTGNASMTGMGLTVVGGVLCFTPAAALGAAMITAGNTLAIGGMAAESGLGFYEASTRKNGAEDGEYEELTKTMLMNLGGFGFGGIAGKTGMKLFNKFVSKELDSLPKLSEAFKSAMVKGNRAEALKIVCSQPEYRKQFAKGLASKLLSDFSISYAGDLVMMGVLDTQDDWESLLQSNLIGILAGMGGDIKDAAHLGMKGDRYRTLQKKEQDGTITEKEMKELALLRQDADIRNLSGGNEGVNEGVNGRVDAESRKGVMQEERDVLHQKSMQDLQTELTLPDLFRACDKKFVEQETLKEGENIYTPEEKSQIQELYKKNSKVVAELLNLQANKNSYIYPENRFSPQMMQKMIEVSQKYPKLYEKLLKYDSNFEWMYRENIIQYFEQAYEKNSKLADELFDMKDSENEPRFFGENLLLVVQNIEKPQVRDFVYSKVLRNGKEEYAIESWQIRNYINKSLDDIEIKIMQLKTFDGKYNLFTSDEMGYAKSVLNHNPKCLNDIQNPKTSEKAKKELMIESHKIISNVLFEYPNLKDFLVNITPENTYSVDMNTKSSDGSFSFICYSNDIIITIRIKPNLNKGFDILSKESRRDDGNISHVWVEFADGRSQIEDIEYDTFKSEGKEFKVSKNLTKTLYDKYGEPIYQEKTIKTDNVLHAYNIEGTERANTPLKGIVKTNQTNNSETKITKEYTHLNGMKTISNIIQSERGIESSYRVVGRNGKTFIDTRRTHKKISENHCESSLNGQKYDIVLDVDKVVVSRLDKNGNKEETITLGSNILDPKLKELYKNLPGDYFFVLKKAGIKRVELFDGGSGVTPEGIVQISKDDLKNPFVLAHELGHVIDHALLNDLNNNHVLMQIFLKEFAKYQQSASYEEGKIIDYFTEIQDNAYEGVIGRKLSYLQEIIAETHALYSGLSNDNSIIGMRGIELQKHFPETMTFVMKKFNHVYSQVNSGTLKQTTYEADVSVRKGITRSNTINIDQAVPDKYPAQKAADGKSVKTNPNEKLYSHEDNVKAINNIKSSFKEEYSDVTDEAWNNIANELAKLKEKYGIEPEGILVQNQLPKNTSTKDQLGNDNHIRLGDNDGRVFKFDKKTGKLVSITVGDDYYLKSTSGRTLHLKVDGTIDSMIEAKFTQDEIEIEINGEKITHEQFLKSEVPGQYTIYDIEPNGKKYVIGLAENMSNGGKNIELNVHSLDGTKTDFVYQSDAKGDRILYKKITTPDGKVQFETKKTYKVLSENHYQTSTDGQYYDVLITDNKVKVTKLDGSKNSTDEVVEYDIVDLSGTKIDWNQEYESEDARINDIFKQLGVQDHKFVIDKRVLSTFKQFGGDEWFKLAQSGTRLLYGDCDIAGNAINSKSIIGISKELYGDTPTASHETGHSVFNLLDLANDTELRKIYESEKEEITATFPDAGLKVISYMLKGNENNARGLNELVAETNLMNSMPQQNETYAQRTVLLQKYFPKTIAYISNKINKISLTDIKANNNGQTIINNHTYIGEKIKSQSIAPDKYPAQKAEAEKPTPSKTDAKASPQHIVVGNKLFELNSKFGEPTKDAIEVVKAEIERLRKTEPEKADNLQIVLDMFATPTEAKKVTETQIDAVVKYLDEHYGHKESYLTTQVKKLGLNILGKFGNRIKGQESTRDKVANYIADTIKDENEAIKKGENFTPKTLLDAYNDVRDKYACRTVFEMGDYTKAPTVANLINEAKALKLQGKIKEASVKLHEAELKAAELQSKDVAETIKQSILKAKENDADLNVMRISNYVSSDGIPILSESQLSEIKYFAAQQGINVEFIRLASEIDPSLTPEQRKEQEKKLTTKSQPSGYTALQINFVTKTGEVIEWQFRGELVDRFAEAEHLPYDLRTGKHPWKQIPELEPLYKPIADLLNEDVMPKHAYKQINRYFTDYYTHLRRLELGFDSEEPKLSNYENYRAKDENGVERNFTYKFDKRLEAKNLIALHDFAEGIKDGLITSERAVEEFNMFLRN